MNVHLQHLQLTEKLFRDVIMHLKQRILRLQSGADEEGLDLDIVSEERASEDQSTVTALRLEICLYSLCVDWVCQQREEMLGAEDDTRRHARDNFFHLMTTVAQAEFARDNHARAFGLSGLKARRRPLSDAQMFTALEGTAERQLASLIAM